jgi:ectoine hydroxylase-related dioxygenase (phytanoyl-CoA dioxygenase family)
MIQDLSVHEGPITDLFPRLRSANDAQAYRLTEDQIRFFGENGYVSGIRILSPVQVEALLSELEDLARPEHEGHDLFYEYHANESVDPNSALFHALGAWRIGRGFHDLLWTPAFTVAASQLLHGSIRFWHDQLFCKPPRRGGVVAWHQDYSYWTRTQPMAHLSCFIALDESTRENGCLRYVPGSHRWDLLPITGLAGDMESINTVLSEEQRELFKPVAVELKPGEASFHHPLMVHGSFENLTDRPRRATVINVFRDGVVSASDKPLLEGVPVISPGQKMGGRFFPLLYEARTEIQPLSVDSSELEPEDVE